MSPEEDKNNYPYWAGEWNSDFEYRKDDLATVFCEMFISLRNNNRTPPTNRTYWRRIVHRLPMRITTRTTSTRSTTTRTHNNNNNNNHSSRRHINTNRQENAVNTRISNLMSMFGSNLLARDNSYNSSNYNDDDNNDDTNNNNA